MIKRGNIGILLLATIFLCTGCGIKDTHSVDKVRDERIAAWKAEATSDRSIPEIQQSVIPLVGELLIEGEAGLLPLLDIMGSAEEAPKTKVLAFLSLEPHIQKYPTFIKRLIEITAKDNETTSRACATQLLGLFDLVETNEKLRQLMSDDESRVSVAAFLVFMHRSDPEALARIEEVFHDEKTNLQQQGSIALGIPDAVAPQHITLFIDVLLNQEMPLAARKRAIDILANSGEESVIAALEKSANEDTDEVIRQMGLAAVAAINEEMAPP